MVAIHSQPPTQQKSAYATLLYAPPTLEPTRA